MTYNKFRIYVSFLAGILVGTAIISIVVIIATYFVKPRPVLHSIARLDGSLTIYGECPVHSAPEVKGNSLDDALNATCVRTRSTQSQRTWTVLHWEVYHRSGISDYIKGMGDGDIQPYNCIGHGGYHDCSSDASGEGVKYYPCYSGSNVAIGDEKPAPCPPIFTQDPANITEKH